MAGQLNSKLKLLFISRYLQQYTDDSHGVSVENIIDYLATMDIACERKSVYRDLELLREFGMDVERRRGDATTYHLLSRGFELAELKLLADAVSACKTITKKKSRELIKRLGTLTSIYGARSLMSDSGLDGRVKSLNEAVYYSIDAIHAAIDSDKKLGFRYFDYNLSRERVYRHDGARYSVSPLALSYAEENYYLFAFDDRSGQIRIYRVDRMSDVEVSKERREHNETVDSFDSTETAGELFSMFSGEQQNVTLVFDNSLATVAIDRFGADTIFVPRENGRFALTAKVALSPNFYGWVFGFGGRAFIESPECARKQYAQMLKNAQAMQ